MLYRKNWTHHTALMNVESLASWLRQQDPNKSYFYLNAKTCLLTQYLRDHGHDGYAVITYYKVDGLEYPLPKELNSIAKYKKPWFKLRTFGGALKEAENCLVQTQEEMVADQIDKYIRKGDIRQSHKRVPKKGT